ncbi:MAG: MCP four helix bundle domain-containing protein [Magnetococcales bacterium]|nr:MCP four helix bundle domain-containing protein [Magnetococcales bacterium]
MNLSIRARLYGGFIFLLAVLLVSSLVAVGMINHLNKRMDRLVEYDLKKLLMVGLIDQNVLEIARSERSIILSEDPKEMKEFAEAIARDYGELQDVLNILRRLIASDQEKAILVQVTETIEQWITINREVQRLGMLNSNVRATQLSENEGRTAMAKAIDILDGLVRQIETFVEQSEGGTDSPLQAKRIRLSHAMKLLLMTILKDEVYMILATSDARMDLYAQAIQHNEQLLFQYRDELATLLVRPADQRTLADFDTHLKIYLEISRQVQELTRENCNHKATLLSIRQGSPLVIQIRDSLRALALNSEKLMNEAKQNSDQDFVLAASMLLAMLGLSFALGAFIAVRISRDVNRGLSQAILALEAVAAGDLGFEFVAGEGQSTDEFAQLIQAINTMVVAERSMVETVKKLAVGNMEVVLFERSQHDDLMRALKMLVHAKQSVADVAEKLAIGDLEVDICPRSPQDRLLHSLKRLVEAEKSVAEMAHALTQDDLSVTVRERSAQDRLLHAMKLLSLAMRERADLRRMLLISEKMSSIGQFAVRVAHEINNPLSTAAMGLQNIRVLLSPHTLDEAVLHRIQQVENNIERTTRVARQMLEYSWTGQLECGFFDLREELREVIELVQATAIGVDITLDLLEPLRVWGDRMKIGQVFRNLIQNAVDASPAEGVIQVDAHCENNWLIAQVRDHGVGIAPKVQSKIFDPFFSTKKSGVGVGLGLPICYSILRLHGGLLDIVNGQDGGVKATLRLPLRPEAATTVDDQTVVENRWQEM